MNSSLQLNSGGQVYQPAPARTPKERERSGALQTSCNKSAEPKVKTYTLVVKSGSLRIAAYPRKTPKAQKIL